MMKKRVIPLLLAAFLLIGMLPVSAYAADTSKNEPVYLGTEAECFSLTAMAEESADDFAARIKETYGVNIIEDITATPKARQYVENALAFIGKEVIESITSIRKLDIHFKAKKNNTYGVSGGQTGLYYVTLYEGFASTTPIHELMHVVNFALDLYVSDIDEVIASINDGRQYGTAWKDGDEHYFAYSYGKERASDDISTIPGSIYANRDGIADRIKSNESPALRKKWEYLRDLCNLYLGKSPMFDILDSQNPTPKKIELSTSNLNLTVGETQKLVATVIPEGTGAKISFKSSSKIVSVDAEGNITANNTGLATITVQAGRVKATCTVYVSELTPKKIELSASNLNMTVGETQKLSATVLPEGTGAKIIYKSSNDRVSVDDKGNIAANSAGTATITVQAGSVKTTCTVNVSKPTPTPTPEPKTDDDPVVKTKVNVLSYPTKCVYFVGEKFDTSGLKVVNYVNDKENDISDSILFYTSDSVRLTQGMPFTTAGAMLIQMQQSDGKVVGQFFITVMNKITDTDKTTDDDTNIEVLSYPTKRVFIAGEKFDISGLKVVDYTDGKVNDISDSISFYTTPFSGAPETKLTNSIILAYTGTMLVQLKYNSDKVIGEYYVTVMNKTTDTDKTPSVKHPFTDVASGAYYENPVIWALNNGITSGTSATKFSPNDSCTRGQVVTFLWRSSGSPEPASTKNPFTDVKSSDYYYKAVLWAVEKGITSGASATKFSPSDTCTSGQVVTFLWRSNGKPTAIGASSLAAQYSSQYYTDAVAWADNTGLLSGTGITFAPNSNSPRADIVTYLYRNVGSPAVNTSADTTKNSDALKDDNAKNSTYQSGDAVSEDISSDTDLLDLWKMAIIDFDLQGGSGLLFPQVASCGIPAKLTTLAPTRPGYIFLGWATTKGAATAKYKPGDTLTVTDTEVTLYAVWKKSS